MLEDVVTDGFGLIRTDSSTAVEVAVVHDGTHQGVSEAEARARLLALAPVMSVLLVEALGAWAEQFDGPNDTDLHISGTDLLEWFSDWRQRVRRELTGGRATP